MQKEYWINVYDNGSGHWLGTPYKTRELSVAAAGFTPALLYRLHVVLK